MFGSVHTLVRQISAAFRHAAPAGSNRRRYGKSTVDVASLVVAESLESRQLLTGVGWDNAEDLTASIAPGISEWLGGFLPFFKEIFESY